MGILSNREWVSMMEALHKDAANLRGYEPFPCSYCNRSDFKNWSGVAIHTARMHKEESRA